MNKMGIVFTVRQISGPESQILESVVEFFFVIKSRYVFSKVYKIEEAFKFCRFTREERAPNKIVYIVTRDGKTIRFIDQDIYDDGKIMYKLDTKEIIETIIMAAKSLNIVSDGSNTKRFGTIIYIAKQYGNFDLVTFNDA